MRAEFAAITLLSAAAHAGDFAAEVIEYRPAPGQFVNDPAFNDPSRALGPPPAGQTGDGGTLSPDNSKLVSLGGFGGSITLRFHETVMDDPCNPLGMDAIVFGNSFWPGRDPRRRWGEAGVIEICRDLNGNGLPDDGWHIVRGSSLPAVPATARRTMSWTAAGSPAGWYPNATDFPELQGGYETTGYELPTVFETLPVQNPLMDGREAHWGYADMSPTLRLGDLSGATGSAAHDDRLDQPEDMPSIDPAAFYTVPDDPMSVGVDPGSGGGDAFDIAWAVDPETGEPSALDGFDFIRISTGVDALLLGGILGEASTELASVAAVRRVPLVPGDADGDGVVGFSDLNAVLAQFGQSGELAGDLNCSGVVDFADLNLLLARFGSVGGAR